MDQDDKKNKYTHTFHKHFTFLLRALCLLTVILPPFRVNLITNYNVFFLIYIKYKRVTVKKKIIYK